ncbi:MAG: hypothetical protein COA78_08870 [Blastopirellula sp.]|nr:MAG: hypothetical protein COA78_08870 [Blastopirellula sp.]
MTRNVIFRYLFPAVLVGITIFHGSFATQVLAQDQVVIELFGRGIHSYYRGEYKSALESLDLAIEQGSVDPRYYYFRGLAKFALDQKDEADADFEQGATLELNATRSYPIGQSLERIQGAARLKLEEHRQTVRVKQYLKKKAWEQARYESLKRAEEEVLRKQVERASANIVVAPGTSDANDPFANADTTVSEPMAIEGVTPTTNIQPAGNDPFGGTPAPAAGTDPFGGTPAPAGADPFGGTPAPATTTPAPATNDPFGGTPAPATTTPAPATNDPFGGTPAPATNEGGASEILSPPVAAALTAIGEAIGRATAPKSDDDSATDDPFGAATAPDTTDDPSGAATTPDTTDDPFGAATAPDTTDDPFGAATTPDTTDDPFGAATTPDTTDDPFGAATTPDTTDDPFGAATTPDTTDDPFGAATTPDTADDPFAN